VFVVAALVAAPAQADQGANAFSGQWATDAGGRPGVAKLTVIDAVQGAHDLQLLGGTPCAPPTTYYAADYRDDANRAAITLCTPSAGRLVGRFTSTLGAGGLNVTLDPSGDAFSGSLTADNFPGVVVTFVATFTGHFAGDGCCPPGTPGSDPSGSSATAPTTGAAGGQAPGTTAQAVTSSVGSGAVGTGPAVVPARALTSAEKQLSREVVRRQVAPAVLLCGLGADAGVGLDARLCTAQLETLGGALVLVHDPPDAGIRRMAVPRLAAPAAISTAAATWAGAVGDAATLWRAAAQTVNRFAGAVQAHDAGAAVLQAALHKVTAGRLAAAIDRQNKAGRAYAAALRRARTDRRLSAVRAWRRATSPAVLTPTVLDHLVEDGVAANRAAAKRVVAARLKLAKGTLRLATVAATQLPTAALVAAARSITIPDLGAIVDGLGANGLITAAAHQALLSDLATCDARRFASDARALAGTPYGAYLADGAAPLTASSGCR
jgi:hypothetical protein